MKVRIKIAICNVPAPLQVIGILQDFLVTAKLKLNKIFRYSEFLIKPSGLLIAINY
jgi:hypothetical protein